MAINASAYLCLSETTPDDGGETMKRPMKRLRIRFVAASATRRIYGTSPICLLTKHGIAHGDSMAMIETHDKAKRTATQAAMAA